MGKLQGTHSIANENDREGTVVVNGYKYCHSSAVRRTETCSSLVRILVRQNAKEHFRWLLHGYTTSFACLQDFGSGTIGLREKNSSWRSNIGSNFAEFTCTRLRYLRGCITLMFAVSITFKFMYVFSQIPDTDTVTDILLHTTSTTSVVPIVLSVMKKMRFSESWF